MPNLQALAADNETIIYLAADGDGSDDTPYQSKFLAKQEGDWVVDTELEQPLTDDQLRAAAVIVDTQLVQSLTDDELRAAPVVVDTQHQQPLTDAQLRAADVNTNITNATLEVTGQFYPATQPVSLTTLPVLPAGSNVIGSIANTGFTATQAGTWNVNNITGTVSLPTGAATATNQLSIPGFNIPEYDTIVITEDAFDNLVSVVYKKDEVTLKTLNFQYSAVTFQGPYKTTTVGAS